MASRIGGQASARAYIEARVEFEPNTGCWLWSAGVTGNGYGALRLSGLPSGAHRASWATRNGDIAAGMCVLHRCDTPLCVNPDHLRLGTHTENMADCAAKGRIRSGATRPRRPRLEVCGRGHERVAGSRECGECRALRNRKISLRRREARAAAGGVS